MYSEHLLVDRFGSAMQTRPVLELGRPDAQARYQGYCTLQEVLRRVIYEEYGITFKRRSFCLCGGIPGESRAPKSQQSGLRVGFRTPPHFASPKHPTTSCSLFRDPSDLEKVSRALAAQERPSEASYRSPTSEGCGG